MGIREIEQIGRMPEALWAELQSALSALSVPSALAALDADSLPGGVALSRKALRSNILGEEEEILWVAHAPEAFGKLGPEDFTALRRQPLARLSALAEAGPEALSNEIASSRLDAAAPVPPLDVLLHALLPSPAVLFCQPTALFAVAAGPRGAQRLHSIFAGRITALPWHPCGLPLAQAAATALSGSSPEGNWGVWIDRQGLVLAGPSLPEVVNSLVALLAQAASLLAEVGIHLEPCPPPQPASLPQRAKVAALRKTVAQVEGVPQLLRQVLSAAQSTDLRAEDFVPPAGTVPDDTQGNPSPAQGDSGTARPPEAARRIILEPDLGLFVSGAEGADLRTAAARAWASVQVAEAAHKLEGTLSPVQVLPREWTQAPGTSRLGSATAPFSGEVALVTGGASGIGKACVEALLARGAAVVSLDINPRVEGQYASPSFLGLVCDLVDEAAIMQAFERVAQAFGGLDMLVLNAGVFPAGCRIESLSLAEWQRVMRINLDSNLIILREAHPLLKQSPAGGRVLVNASKNVLAPGAGAAAYSSSKAAVTQMARVAALEWGKDGIRVNTIHPDAIFDTGIWSEEVLQARAAHYGLTVQQYKTRNILGVELDSHYVAELVADMLGPRFAKITGAQIPVDGGSDRVI